MTEAALIPVVVLPFLVDPYLKRCSVCSRGVRAGVHTHTVSIRCQGPRQVAPIDVRCFEITFKLAPPRVHLCGGLRYVDLGQTGPYTVVLHGSGANSGQWLLCRLVSVAAGRADVTVFPNYLPGFAHLAVDGGVDELADKVLPQLDALFGGAAEEAEVHILGHSLGGLLLAELLQRRARAGARARYRLGHALLLAAPLRGSELLGWALRTAPEGAIRLLRLREPPHTDFLPRCTKGVELSGLVRSACAGTSSRSDLACSVTLVSGGTDFIVRPESGLNCPAADEDTAAASPSTDAASWVYVEALGHYSAVAVGPFWEVPEVRRVLGVPPDEPHPPLREPKPAKNVRGQRSFGQGPGHSGHAHAHEGRARDDVTIWKFIRLPLQDAFVAGFVCAQVELRAGAGPPRTHSVSTDTRDSSRHAAATRTSARHASTCIGHSHRTT